MRGLVGVLTASVVGLIIVGVIIVLAMLLTIYVEKGAVQLSGGDFVAIVVALLVSIGGMSFYMVPLFIDASQWWRQISRIRLGKLQLIEKKISVVRLD